MTESRHAIVRNRGKLLAGAVRALVLAGASLSWASGSGGDTSSAEAVANLRPGMWSGGYGVLEGDAPTWYTVIADLEGSGRKLSGALRRGGRLSAELRDGVVHLSIRQKDRKLNCEAHFEGNSLLGVCNGGKERFDLQLLREEGPSSEALEELAGVYAGEDGGRILIRKSIHLVMSDLGTGEVRALYAEAPDRFIAGQRFAVAFPLGMRVHFERGDGAVQSLVIEDADGEVRRAKRCCPYEVEELTFANDGVTLAASLYLPPGPGPHPAAVYVHGSGRQTRAGAGNWPLFLVAQGIAVLAYDKRGQGSSGGRYALRGGGHDNVPHMQRRATDVRAAVETLKQRADIDADRVGLFGGSQAGWIMPMVAETGGIAFTVAISGGATQLSLEDRFSRWADENGSGGESFDVLIARLRQLQPRDYDFRPHFRAQSAPGLWLYGGKDRSNPSILCKEMLEEIAAEYARDFTVVLFPDGNHGLWQAKVGGSAETATLRRTVPRLHQTIVDWLAEKGIRPGSASSKATR